MARLNRLERTSILEEASARTTGLKKSGPPTEAKREGQRCGGGT